MDSTYRLVTFFGSSEENRSLPLTIHSILLPSSFQGPQEPVVPLGTPDVSTFEDKTEDEGNLEAPASSWFSVLWES